MATMDDKWPIQLVLLQSNKSWSPISTCRAQNESRLGTDLTKSLVWTGRTSSLSTGECLNRIMTSLSTNRALVNAIFWSKLVVWNMRTARTQILTQDYGKWSFSKVMMLPFSNHGLGFITWFTSTAVQIAGTQSVSKNLAVCLTKVWTLWVAQNSSAVLYQLKTQSVTLSLAMSERHCT